MTSSTSQAQKTTPAALSLTQVLAAKIPKAKIEIASLDSHTINTAVIAIDTEGRIKLGSLLAEIGREVGGVDLEIERDKTPLGL